MHSQTVVGAGALIPLAFAGLSRKGQLMADKTSKQNGG
jgi:hypothetical protein